MHARHYAYALGRFLQPDPARAEANQYAYARSNPSSLADPRGTFPCLIPIVGWSVCGAAVQAAVTLIVSAPRLIAAISAIGVTALKIGSRPMTLRTLSHVVTTHGQTVTRTALQARDAFRPGLENATRFLSNSRILPAIKDTLRSPTAGRVTSSGYVEYARRFTFAQGIDGYGNLQYWLRVIMYNGQIIAVYPTSRAFR